MLLRVNYFWHNSVLVKYNTIKVYIRNFFRIFISQYENEAFNSVKLISKKYKFIWIRNPKVANSSIKVSLTSSENKHLKCKMKKISLNDMENKYKDYFKFIFVRNPWSRVVSFYLNKLCYNNKARVGEIFAKFKGIYYKMPFEEFIEWLCSPEAKDENADKHFISQYRYVYNNDNKCVVDFIGKFENLKSDFEKVCNSIGISNIALPHYKNHKKYKYSNISSKIPDNKEYYKSFYNDKTRKIVRERYKKDIELFNYKF